MMTHRSLFVLFLFSSPAISSGSAQPIDSPFSVHGESAGTDQQAGYRERIWKAEEAFSSRIQQLLKVDPAEAARLEKAYRKVRQTFRLKPENRTDPSQIEWLVGELDLLGDEAVKASQRKATLADKSVIRQ